MPQGVIVPPKPKMQLLIIIHVIEKILLTLFTKLDPKDQKILAEFKSGGSQKSKKKLTAGKDYEKYSGAIMVTMDSVDPGRMYNKYTWIYGMDLKVGDVCDFDYLEKDGTTVALITGVV